jgi:hypothetical protein
MTKEALWEIYVKKNPCFLTEGASLSAAGLRKFFDTTYDQGYFEGEDVSRDTGGKFDSNLFGGLFGKR